MLLTYHQIQKEERINKNTIYCKQILLYFHHFHLSFLLDELKQVYFLDYYVYITILHRKKCSDVLGMQLKTILSVK